MPRAVVPTRQDRRWEIEMAPLRRLQASKVAEIKPGTSIAVLGFTLTAEKGEAVRRAEYLFVAGNTDALLLSPT